MWVASSVTTVVRSEGGDALIQRWVLVPSCRCVHDYCQVEDQPASTTCEPRLKGGWLVGKPAALLVANDVAKHLDRSELVGTASHARDALSSENERLRTATYRPP